MNDDLPFCYLTTRGRVTARPHEIEIWFVRREDTIFMLAGGRERADWVANIKADPSVTVRIGDLTYSGTGRIVIDPDEDSWARRALVGKYAKGSDDLVEWGLSALPVAIDLIGTGA